MVASAVLAALAAGAGVLTPCELPVVNSGAGTLTFSTSDKDWRKGVKGFVANAPSFRSIQSGVLQFWVVAWRGEKVSYYATDGVSFLYPERTESDGYLHLIAAQSEKSAVLGSPLEDDPQGKLKDVRLCGRTLSLPEIQKLLEGRRRAKLKLSSYFGTEGVLKKVLVQVAVHKDIATENLRLECFDSAGRSISSERTISSRKAKEVFELNLPVGEYCFRLKQHTQILAEETYGVLSSSNAYELKGVAGEGRPREMRLLHRILPCPDTMSEEKFRSVGDTHFGELGGIRYLETGCRAWDRFVFRLEVDTNAPLHCIEFDYPDDKKRTMDLVVQDTWYGRNPANWTASDYTLAVGIATGGEEYSNQNKILTHRCLFWTGSGQDVSIVVSALKDNAPAAISEIRVYTLPDNALPFAQIREPQPNSQGQKRYVGQFWEDPAVIRDFRVAHGSLFDMDKQISRHIAQMRYTGQNMLAYPGAWYQGLIGQGGYSVRGHRSRYLEAYYEKFDHTNLYLMPTVEVLNVPERIDGFSSESLGNGALHATSYNVRSDGRVVSGWHGAPPNHNVAHPHVQDEIARIVTALANEGASHPSFKGVTLFLPMDVCMWWGTIEAGYNDYCIDAFEKASGVHVPVDRTNPLRGKQYSDWLRANAYDKWVQWRCDIVTDFYVRLAGILASRRPDLMLRLDLEPPVDVTRDLKANRDYFTDRMRPRLMREAGIDAAALTRRIPNLIFGPIVFNVRQRKRDYWMTTPEIMTRYIRLPETLSWWKEMAETAFPQIVIRDDFWESNVGAKSKEDRALNCSWFREIPWRCSSIQPSARNALKYFALPLRYGDILGVSRGGFLICDYGMEEIEVAFAKAFRSLPAVKMSDVADLDGQIHPTVRVRTCKYGGCSYFYLVNTGDLPVQLTVDFPSDTHDLAKDAPWPSSQKTLTLDAYELRSFRASSGTPGWKGY